jgi:phage-related baseplate assembly protein
LRGVTYPGADIPDTLGRAQVAVEAYVNKHFKLGHDITRAGLDGAAMVEGMQNVFVDAPATDLATDLTQARRCLSTALTHAGTAL